MLQKYFNFNNHLSFAVAEQNFYVKLVWNLYKIVLDSLTIIDLKNLSSMFIYIIYFLRYETTFWIWKSAKMLKTQIQNLKANQKYLIKKNNTFLAFKYL